MSLGDEQREFSLAIAKLIIWAYEHGYELTTEDFHSFPEDQRHKNGSYHYRKLAADLNLYKDRVWLKSSGAHQPLGEYWESLGGTWGGRFGRRDGNHYSWGEGSSS